MCASERTRRTHTLQGVEAMSDEISRPIELLLVEDNPGDVKLATEALKEDDIPCNLSTVGDGREALAFLRREGEYDGSPRPDMILLDLRMPNMDGHEVLAELKYDGELRSIPVLVLSTSADPLDILNAYDLGASFYVTKPSDLDEYITTMHKIKEFCLTVADLPPRS